MQPVPYSPDELTPRGFFPLLAGGQAPIYSTPVTPRENFLANLRGETPLWVPMFSDCKKFMPAIFPDNKPHGIVLEAAPFSREGLTGGKGMFNIPWVWEAQVGGSTVVPGNPMIKEACELDTKLVWPEPATWDWAGSAALNKEYLHTDFVRGTTIFCGFFERLIALMDFQYAAIALIDEDDKPYIHRFFDRLCGVYEEMIVRIKKYYDLDLIEFHDDWGSQRAPFFSLATVREMILPYMKRVVDCVHANGMIFELHCCGCNADLTPAMIEAGVDAWAPQPSANDTRAIFEKYGDRITIGMSCPLAPGSAEADYIAWAKQFVDECVARPGMRSPYLFDMRTPLSFRETVYTLSRRKFCGESN